MTRIHIILSTVLLSAATLAASIAHSDPLAVADNYMKAYARFDLKEMSQFYSKDAKFRDPTSEMWGEYAWNIDGRDNIMKRMESFFSKFDDASASYNVKEKYESAGHTIYTGKVKFSFTEAGKLETSCMRISTIVSVKNGKVIEHRDYIDYDKLESSKKSGDQDCH